MSKPIISIKKLAKFLTDETIKANLHLAVAGDDKCRELFSEKITDFFNEKAKEIRELIKQKFTWKQRMFGDEDVKMILKVHSISGEIIGYLNALIELGILKEESINYLKKETELYRKIINHEELNPTHKT